MRSRFLRKRHLIIYLTLCRLNIAAVGWIVGFASSIDSAALKQATAEFGVSEVTESLATGS